ncbi:MAG: hypothetical protein A4E66_02481 [Syntrophus sp. PtaB.Bin001]|nr:MAG: hypothetical protein A4E66_02481 [Syntrophus sp. PtaB.Bin001]
MAVDQSGNESHPLGIDYLGPFIPDEFRIRTDIGDPSIDYPERLLREKLAGEGIENVPSLNNGIGGRLQQGYITKSSGCFTLFRLKVHLVPSSFSYGRSRFMERIN